MTANEASMLELQQGKVKKFNVDLQKQRNSYKRSRLKNKVAKYACIIFNIAVPMLAMVLYYWFKLACCGKSHLTSVRTMLTQHIYGQDRAIDNIMESFETDSNSKLIFLYGPTGVGKTYTASLMLEHLQNYTNVMHFAGADPSLSMKSIVLKLYLFDFMFVVIDDISLNSNRVKEEINNVVKTGNSLQRDIYILLIYNNEIVTKDFTKIRETGFRDKLELDFRDIPASKYFIEFTSLDRDILKKCILYELLNYDGINFSNEIINDIMLNFDVEFDGCTGVHNKIKAFVNNK